MNIYFLLTNEISFFSGNAASDLNEDIWKGDRKYENETDFRMKNLDFGLCPFALNFYDVIEGIPTTCLEIELL